MNLLVLLAQLRPSSKKKWELCTGERRRGTRDKVYWLSVQPRSHAFHLVISTRTGWGSGCAWGSEIVCLVFLVDWKQQHCPPSPQSFYLLQKEEQDWNGITCSHKRKKMNQDFIMVSALPGKVSFNWSIWKELSRASEVSLNEKSQPSSQRKVILLQISLPLSLT